MKAETVLKITDALNLAFSHEIEDLNIEETEGGIYQISCKLFDREMEFDVRITYVDDDDVFLEILMDSDTDEWEPVLGGGLWKYLTFHFLDLLNDLEGRR